MKFLRNRFVSKFIAALLFLLIVLPVITPTMSWALTHGPHQPEYTAYEEPGATDMVNLLTGDFSFRLPAIDIPGPEGGFSMPLSYNAGIGLDQEASWVGLGWSLNAGAIARNVVEFPDDAQSQVFEIHRADDDIARGWTSSIPAVGQIGWDSNEGHYGRISILGLSGVSYKNGSITGVQQGGIGVSSEGVEVDVIAIVSAAITVATAGAGAASQAVASTALAKQIGIGIAIEAATTVAAGVATPNFNSGGYWKLSKEEDKRLFHTNYWIWLEQTRYENMYGTLYLQNAPIIGNTFFNPKLASGGTTLAYLTEADNLINEGAASDMHYAYSGGSYHNITNPSSLATDNYSVMGQGVSGAIAPYRLDAGSLSMPRDMSAAHVRLAMARHRNYKVQYRYKGANNNSYYHQVGKTGSVLDLNTLKYGVTTTLSNTNISTPTDLTYGYDDSILADINPLVEGDRVGLNNNKLAQLKNVEWYSNQELINGVDGFIDCMSTAERSNLTVGIGVGISISILQGSQDSKLVVGRSAVNLFTVNEQVNVLLKFPPPVFEVANNIYASATVTGKGSDYITVSANFNNFMPTLIEGHVSPTSLHVKNSTIGGYKITREDGRTFHYSLPIYDWSNYTKITDKVDTDKITEISRIEPFPSTWLLTAITGSDYVDRNNNHKVDEDDWGYWVDFDYGKFSNNYDWRMPYSGDIRSSDDQSDTFSAGVKEQYYLNKIKTRSHTALFLKKLRRDGRGADSNEHSSSLGLDEIVLLTNEDYEANESNLTSTNSADTDVTWLSSNDSFESTLDIYDINATTRSWLDQKALKRVKFHYDYSLAIGTANSFDVSAVGVKTNTTSTGKLTLNRISMYGRNSIKTVPDFIFNYDDNPGYDQHDWDGWGMYNSGGTSSGTSHKASTNNTQGNAWSLSEIITPMGTSMQVEYERDSYSSISGNDVMATHNFSATDLASLTVSGGTSAFQVGESVRVAGTGQYNCSGPGVNPTTESIPIDFTGTISSISGSNLLFNFIGPTPNPQCSSGFGGILISASGTISRTIEKNGGNTRVKFITTTDGVGGESYKTRYLYTESIAGKEISSGVVAQEPNYIKGTDYSFYDLFDFPNTPVMYGKVTVLNGKLTNDSDYHTKQVYDFTTPHQNMVSHQKTMYNNNTHISQLSTAYKEFLTKAHNKIDVSTSQIGKLNSVKVYDKQNQLIHNTEMTYSSDVTEDVAYDHQGVFSESTLLFEILKGDGIDIHHRALRTTKRYYPTFLEQVVTTNRDGHQTTTENKEWDFITGKVVKEQTEDALGIKTLTEIIPAYKKYSEMGPLSVSASNRHMLGADAATYVYKLNAADQKVGLIGASIQTWKKDWSNYREANSSTGIYTNVNNGEPRWRRHASYLWQGDASDLQSDGTLNFDDATDRFNFSASTHAGWQYGGEITRYDNYSMPVESKDLNELYTTTKTDINKSTKVLEAGNAKYTEVAYSGAEYDYQTVGGKTYVDGEVRITSSSQMSTAKAHTGDESIRLTSAGQKGFHYVMQSGEYDANRNYRLGVWVHQTNADKGELYYTIGGSTQTPVVSEYQAGEWKRLEMLIPASALNGTTLEVGVRKKPGTASGDVYVDDFRFQPMDAGMTGYVYNDLGQLRYMLDNENRFTEYVYNDAGRLTTTYVETFQYGRVKVSGSDRHYSNMDQ